MTMINDLVGEFNLITRDIFGSGFIPLHRPVFLGNERQYLVDCIDSNFVSSVGAKVTEMEQRVAAFTGAKFAVATVNGTAALHIALQVAGVARGDEVISQALTFVATCNAVSYSGGIPVFIDVDKDTMGLSPTALKQFLESHAEMRTTGAWNKGTGRRIAACVPMHTFGMPCRIAEIAEICAEWSIPLVEDTAESLGSFVAGKHTGTFGQSATFSFNGNKIVTAGGGGMIITNSEEVARLAKHLTTTAKVPHPYEFVHDSIGYNYRMPNLNAALGCAQMEMLDAILSVKADLALQWESFFENRKVKFVKPIADCKVNHWLNAIVLDNAAERDEFLKKTNEQDIMTRPIWCLMNRLEMFKDCQTDCLENSQWLQDRVVNIPSSVPDGALKKV